MLAASLNINMLLNGQTNQYRTASIQAQRALSVKLKKMMPLLKVAFLFLSLAIWVSITLF